MQNVSFSEYTQYVKFRMVKDGELYIPTVQIPINSESKGKALEFYNKIIKKYKIFKERKRSDGYNVWSVTIFRLK